MGDMTFTVSSHSYCAWVKECLKIYWSNSIRCEKSNEKLSRRIFINSFISCKMQPAISTRNNIINMIGNYGKAQTYRFINATNLSQRFLLLSKYSYSLPLLLLLLGSCNRSC